MPSSALYGGGATGQAQMGMCVSPSDAVKMVTTMEISCNEADFPTVNVEGGEGAVLFDSVWQKCKAANKVAEVPRGASFKEAQWATFQAWWEMRSVFAKFDTDNSGALDMSEVGELQASKPEIVKWGWEDMTTDSSGAVPFAEFQAWWSMRRHFDTLDKDGSGELDKSEMIEMAKWMGIEGFEVADMDLTAAGMIPFDEFQAWWRMRMMFMQADTGGEGHLTRQEVKELARALGNQISVRSMDVDGDDCIDFSEFFSWWNMRHKFDKYDTNGNGVLSYEEADKLGSHLGATVNFQEMDEDGDGNVDFKEFTEWYKMRRCFEKIDVSGDGNLDHEEIKRLAYMLNMDLQIEDIDKSGDGEVDFAEFQKWWGGNKTRAQVMSRVAMQMDRDAANKEEAQPGLPAMVFVAMAAGLTALFVLPVFATILTSHNLNNWELVEEEVQ